MHQTDRNALLLRATQPYADWVNSLEPEVALTVADLEPDLYLLPGVEDLDAEERLLRTHFTRIFENALHTWTEDRQRWPECRDWETFSAWFSWEFIGMVWEV
jgi:hypothetical protein